MLNHGNYSTEILINPERRLASLREVVATIDITIRLFDPGANPEDFMPKRHYRPLTGFAGGTCPAW